MPDKLDPALSAHLHSLPEGASEGDRSLRVLVSLQHAPDDAETARLRAAGLALGSVVGDIVTGSIAVRDLGALAADPLVVQVEGGRTLEPE